MSGVLLLTLLAQEALGEPARHGSHAVFVAASFMGAALTSHLCGGQSIREGLLAAILMTLVPLTMPVLVPTAPSAGAIFLSGIGALAGGRFGALFTGSSGRREGKMTGSVMAALMLIGAFYLHCVLAALLSLVSAGLAVLAGLTTAFATPALAGAALQLSYRRHAEDLLLRGVTLIGVCLLLLAARETHNLGILMLLGLGLSLVGAFVYGIALPGVFTIRSSRSWPHRARELPVAVVVADSHQTGANDARATSAGPDAPVRPGRARPELRRAEPAEHSFIRD